MKIVLNFLPIIIIFLLVSYSDLMAQWSHTILGKLFSVILIIFYTRIDIVFGLVVCALVIFYYQTDYVEGFIPKSETEGFSSDILPETDNEIDDVDKDVSTEYSFENLEDAYPSILKDSVIHDSKANKFRQKNCSKGHLVHKGQIINNEIAEHVFPEIEQNDFHKCNICDHSCDFKIIDRKIDAQEKIMTQISGRI
jgi:hypothetical protein